MDYLQQRHQNLAKIARLTDAQLRVLQTSEDPRAREFLDECVVEDSGQLRVSVAALMSSGSWRYAEQDHPAVMLVSAPVNN